MFMNIYNGDVKLAFVKCPRCSVSFDKDWSETWQLWGKKPSEKYVFYIDKAKTFLGVFPIIFEK